MYEKFQDGIALLIGLNEFIGRIPTLVKAVVVAGCGYLALHFGQWLYIIAEDLLSSTPMVAWQLNVVMAPIATFLTSFMGIIAIWFFIGLLKDSPKFYHIVQIMKAGRAGNFPRIKPIRDIEETSQK